MRYPLLIFCLLFASSCDNSSGPVIIVMSEVQQYGQKDDPPTTGAKFYHLIDNSSYKTSRLIQVEKGTVKKLGAYKLQPNTSGDQYASLSFFPERTVKSWWAWCERGATTQIPHYQGAIDDGWRLANASLNRRKTLVNDVEIIDVVVFTPDDQFLELSELDKIWGCETLDELITATGSIPECRVAAITLEKAELVEDDQSE